MNNAKKVSIVDYADVLKASLENENSVIVGYKPSNDGYFGISKDLYVDSNFNINDIKLVDSNGNPIVIDSLKYYTVGKDNKLVSLTSNEVEALILNNEKAPILVSSNELSGNVISSDLGLVTESMDNLVGYINADGKLEYTAEIGESGLFGAMFDVINYYRNINNSLKAGIVGEANAVSAIAQAYQAIDTAGANVANNVLNAPYYGGGSSGGSSGSSSTNEYTVNGMTAEQIDASTTSMISNTKASVSSGVFDKISNFLGSTCEPGKIGKISVSKLGDTINKIIPSLEEDAKTSTQMKGSIEDFISQINNNGKLKGEAWEKVKKNLSNYKDLLDVSIDSSEFLANVMETAKKMIEDFLNPDTEIDDSVLPELEEQLIKLKNNIADMEAKIQQMKNSQREVCSFIKDSKGKTITDKSTCHKEPSDEEIRQYESLLSQYKTEAEEIEKKIKRIKDFAEVVKNAQKLIKDAVEQVKKAFENPIQNVGDNSNFASRFSLDLSAYGLVGTSAGDYLKGYMDQIKGGGNNNSESGAEFNAADLLEKGASQKGVKYHSMHYGPRELGGGGFGCAMFVAYCYNEMLHPGEHINGGDENTSGFYGGCSHFYGNITTDNFDYHNKGFVEVSEADRQAGDIVCFVTTRESDDIRGSARNCFHVGIYTGDGNKIMHSTGMGITNNGAGGVGISTIGEYKRAKISSLEHQYKNGTLSDYNELTYNGVQDSGIQVIYLRYVGENNTGDLVQI